MKIRGKEIKFLRTVKTTSDLAELCPEKDITRLGELFSSNVSDTIVNSAKFIQILNEGYEMSKHIEAKLSGGEYEPNIITMDELLYLDEETFTKLQEEALSAYNNVNVTVELEENKKKEKNQE